MLLLLSATPLALFCAYFYWHERRYNKLLEEMVAEANKRNGGVVIAYIYEA